MTAFAFNSILCRLALGTGTIDAAGFTAVRLLSGAITLAIIFSLIGRKKAEAKNGNWLSAFFLFAYAACFSFAYVNLTTAAGALILFGSVQATMILAAVFKGERPGRPEWGGLTIALGGLIYLVFPGLGSPPLFYALLMALAGIAWGFYTLRGRKSVDPLADTTGNFIRSVPMTFFASIPFLPTVYFTSQGVLFAVLSGAIASGIGYAVWYAALQYHTATRAAILQLAVPVLAAIGGALLLSEIISARLILATLLVLGGIGLAIAGRK